MKASPSSAAQSPWQRALLLGLLSGLLLVALACAGGPSTRAPRTGSPPTPNLIAEVAEPLPEVIRSLISVRVDKEVAPTETAPDALNTASSPRDSTPRDSTPRDSTPRDSTIVTLEGDQNLRWTTYRDLDGHLVIELPGTRNAAPALIETDDESLLISRIEISSADDGFRGTPTTRLRVIARRPAVHALEAHGTSLALRFDPIAPAVSPAAGTQAPPSIESESLAVTPVIVQPVQRPDALQDDTADKVAGVATGSTLAEDLGIRDAQAQKNQAQKNQAQKNQAQKNQAQKNQAQKRLSSKTHEAARTIAGKRANETSQLPATGHTVFDIVTRIDEGTLVVEVRADGPLAWSEFRLQNPARFVVDLPGTFNRAGSRSLPLEHPLAARARLGQFQPKPDPIARLVLDLHDPDATVQVVRTPTGLELRIDAPR